MGLVVEQTQLETVWISTVDITNPMTRALDSLIDVMGGNELDRPYAGTKATEFQYETLVWPSNGDGPMDVTEIDCARYQTLEEAKAGHARMIKKWRQRGKLDKQ